MGEYEWMRALVAHDCRRHAAMIDRLREHGRVDVSGVPGALILAVVSQLRREGIAVREFRGGVDGCWLEVDGEG